MSLAPPTSSTVWDRVVCAVDLSTASVAAARLAVRLIRESTIGRESSGSGAERGGVS
jgi:hypothetical protein